MIYLNCILKSEVGITGFRKFHPAAAAIYFCVVITFSMFHTNPVMLAISLICAACDCALLQQKPADKKTLFMYIAMFLIVTLSNPLFSQNGSTPLFKIGGFTYFAESVAYGASAASILVSVILWCKTFYTVMTNERILYLFGKTAPQLGMVVCCALRFVPLFLRKFRDADDAQRAVGMYSYGGIKEKVKSLARVFTATLSASLESAMDTAAAMRARGYGRTKRSVYSPFRFKASDTAVIAFSLFVALLIAFCQLKGITDYGYYPALSSPDFSPTAVVCYIGYFLLCILPTIIEIWEAVIWKCCISRT